MITEIRNIDVANDLGLSESGASRIRGGKRNPSLKLMQTVERVYGWSVQEQSDLLTKRQWYTKFEKVLNSYYAKRQA